MKVFVDSDVIISSLLSTKGASYLLLQHKDITPIISSYSNEEIEVVIERLNIQNKLFKPLKLKLHIVKLSLKIEKIKKNYHGYVTDADDAHIVAGATFAKTKFLITYNIRHFKKDKIKEDLNIIVLTPGQFLQYLRSLK